MDPNPAPHRSIARLGRHDFMKRLGPGEAETLEILGREFQPGAGVRLSDDRTGEWTTHPEDVTVVSPSRIVVERATHRDVPSGVGDGPGPSRRPCGWSSRVHTCPRSQTA